VPQDIPLEASETLAFVPASLEAIPNAPRFTLRAPSNRDKRFHTRLIREIGIMRHSAEVFRAEVLNGLKTLWSPADYAEHSPRLETYWKAQDDFELQLKDDPELKWQWDADEEMRIGKLIELVTRAHEPLRVLAADNAEAGEMAPILIIAVAVETWTGLPVSPRLERGYLHPDCVEEMRDALAEFEKANGLVDTKGDAKGLAFTELFIAATQRMYLTEDEEKNSASPSPSGKPLPSSNTGTDTSGGTSTASAPSTKTPETA
jgi:hypothetical protein